MEKIKIETEYIKLDQFLKWTGVSGSGAEAKNMIIEGRIKVNGEKETRRGRKLRNSDIIDIEGRKFLIE